MPAAATTAMLPGDGVSRESDGIPPETEFCEQGIWLCGGGELPAGLLAALTGRAPWAPPAGSEGGVGGSVSAGSGQGGVLDALVPGAELAMFLQDAVTGPDSAAVAGSGAAPGYGVPLDAVVPPGSGAVPGSNAPPSPGAPPGGDERRGLDAPAGGLARLDDGALIGVVRGWRRLASWVAAMEQAAVAELADRRIGEAESMGCWAEEASRYASAEIAAALTLTRTAADTLVGRALALRNRPSTAAALAEGRIDLPRALVIIDALACLEPRLAAAVEARVLPAAAAQTTGQLRQAVARAVLAADPLAAEERQAEAQKSARVERWAEPAGTGALAGRDMPAADVLAADNRINALAAALKADGAVGGMDFLRAQVFIGLLLDRPIATPADPATDVPTVPGTPAAPGTSTTAGTPTAPGTPAAANAPAAAGAPAAASAAGGAGRGAPGVAPVPAALTPISSAPAPVPSPASASAGVIGRWGQLTGSINLTLPLATLLGYSGAPGQVAGFGPVPSSTAAELAAAAIASPGIRWCVTVTDAAGRAAGHGCPTRQYGAATSAAAAGGRTGAAADGEWAFTVTVTALATGHCDHQREAAGYTPPASLRHLIEIRDLTCCFPGCRRPATQCDLDHTLAYQQGGRSCECNLAPLCRFHHRLKQAQGWQLTQPEPGILTWTTPSGWRFTNAPHLLR